MANLRAKDFDFGVPKTLAFRGPGAGVPTKIAGADPQVRFNTTAGDSVYLDEIPAGDVERELQELGIAYGETFRLQRARTSHGGSRFIVERAAPGRNADSGGHNVPERSHDVSYTQDVPPAQAAQSRVAAAAQPITPTSAKFLAAYMVAVDTLLETKVYAQRKGLALEIHCEDVRALAATLVISADKTGGR